MRKYTIAVDQDGQTIRQRTPAWYAFREEDGVITASAALHLVGGFEGKTLNSYYRLRKGLAVEEDLSRNPNVQRGIANEPNALQALMQLRETFASPGICVRSLDHDKLVASLDALEETAEGPVPWEIKVPHPTTMEEVRVLGEQAEAFRRAWPQVQHQILVTGAARALLWFYDPDAAAAGMPIERQGRLFVVERDEAFLAGYLPKALDMSRRLLEWDEPPLDPSRDVFHPTGEDVARWDALAERYRKAAQAKEAHDAAGEAVEKELEDTKKELTRVKGTFAKAAHDGLEVTTSGSRRLDAKALVEALAIPASTVARFEKVSVSTRVTDTRKPRKSRTAEKISA